MGLGPPSVSLLVREKLQEFALSSFVLSARKGPERLRMTTFRSLELNVEEKAWATGQILVISVTAPMPRRHYVGERLYMIERPAAVGAFPRGRESTVAAQIWYYFGEKRSTS